MGMLDFQAVKQSVYQPGKSEGNHRRELDADLTRMSLALRNMLVITRTATAASYTALSTDTYIGVTSTAVARTITLPAAATVESDKLYIIKDESGAAGTNNITIDGNASETIDGQATATIGTNYGSRTIFCDGSNWFTIGICT